MRAGDLAARHRASALGEIAIIVAVLARGSAPSGHLCVAVGALSLRDGSADVATRVLSGVTVASSEVIRRVKRGPK